MGSSLRIIRSIYLSEGGLAAFYRGLVPNLVGNSSSWAIYFLFYGNIKDAIRSVRAATITNNDDSTTTKARHLGASEYFVASGTAGLLTAVLTNPIWVIKTRMLSTGARTPGAYPSFISGARHILQSEGLRGFYRGLTPALFGVSHGAFQFMAYEQLKLYRLSSASTSSTTTTAANRQLDNLDFFIISGLSKIFAVAITYPYQVLRTRLQSYDASAVYRSLGDAVRQIWRNEGVAGFYKGLGPSIVRVLPSTWVTFLVYENTKKALPSITGSAG